jgi:hypothetical protein
VLQREERARGERRGESREEQESREERGELRAERRRGGGRVYRVLSDRVSAVPVYPATHLQ